MLKCIVFEMRSRGKSAGGSNLPPSQQDHLFKLALDYAADSSTSKGGTLRVFHTLRWGQEVVIELR